MNQDRPNPGNNTYITELLPSHFEGLENSDFNTFFTKFNLFCAFHNIDDQRKCLLFAGLLSKKAFYYYCDLERDVIYNWDLLSCTFVKQFGADSVLYIRKFSLWERKQKLQETVDEYIHAIYEISLKTGLSSAEKCRNFVFGLRQPLRGFVTSNNPQTIQQAEIFAKRAELLFPVLRDSPNLCNAVGLVIPNTETTENKYEDATAAAIAI